VWWKEGEEEDNVMNSKAYQNCERQLVNLLLLIFLLSHGTAHTLNLNNGP